MKKILFLSSLAIISLLTACERENNPLSPNESESANTGKLPPEGNYIPFTYGSKWAYDDGMTIDTTYLGRDTVLKGKSHKEFVSSTEQKFTRYENKIYYSLVANPYLVTDDSGLIEYMELRTDYPVGKKYEQQFEKIGGGYYKVESTLLNIVKERYVKGKKYSNVLEVLNRSFDINSTGGTTNLGSTYLYYAKDKGLIEEISIAGGKRLNYYNY